MAKSCSRSITDLRPSMRAAAAEVLVLCREAGLDILVVGTYRTIREQARLYRRGRMLEEIVAKQAELDKRGYSYLSAAIDRVGPQPGRRIVTRAGPGESYHNWGRALDCVPWLDVKTLAWDVDSDDVGPFRQAAELWQVYGACVHQAGLEWGGNWGWDKPHCQNGTTTNPLDIMSPPEASRWAEEMGWYDDE